MPACVGNHANALPDRAERVCDLVCFPCAGIGAELGMLTPIRAELGMLTLIRAELGVLTLIIIIMYIYHALISALSAHMIHINLNMIFYTHVKHSPTKTIYIKYYFKK